LQDIRRQMGIAIRWIPLIILGALATGVVAYAFTSSQPQVYQATAQLQVLPGQDVTDYTEAEDIASRYAVQATDRAVVTAALERIDMTDDPSDVRERLEAYVDEDDPLQVVIDVRDEDPESARRLANAIGLEMVSRVEADLMTGAVRAADDAIRQANRLITPLQTRVDGLRRKAQKNPRDWAQIGDFSAQITEQQLRIQALRPSSSAFVRNLLRWSERPRLPEEPVEPRPLYWTLLALAAGGMLAAGIAFTLEYLRHYGKIRDERDVAAATGLVPLGTIIEDSRNARGKPLDQLALLRYPRGQEAESYRGLLTRMGFASGSTRTMMVTSPRDSDASSVVAANIALAYAEAGRNVVLVDADVRSPRQHSLFQVSAERGLTTVLANADTPLAMATVPTPHARLSLMPAGPLPRESVDPLGPGQLNVLLRRLLFATDLVVFDSPSLSGHLEAAVIAANVDGALLVIPESSRQEDAAAAALALQNADAAVLGAVIHRRVNRSRRGPRVDVLPAPRAGFPLIESPNATPRRIPVSIATPQGSRPQPLPGTATAQASRPSAASPKASPAPAPTGAPVATATSASPPAAASGRNGVGSAPSEGSGPYAVPFEPSRSTQAH
jgi:non-specific protein-tyrosine kinase